MMCRPYRQGHDRECRILLRTGSKATPIDDEKVFDFVCLTERVEDRRLRILSHSHSPYIVACEAARMGFGGELQRNFCPVENFIRCPDHVTPQRLIVIV